MRAPKWFFVVMVGLVSAIAFGIVRQRDQLTELRGELTRRKAQALEASSLQRRNERLVAAQPTEPQLEKMAADLLLADQLRSQQALMQKRVDAAVAAQPAARQKPEIISLAGTSVAANLWQDAGRATPDAALQTALWAAANGDLDAVVACLLFDAETKQQAGAAFARLPAVLQNELGTPERMIALLTAVEAPLGRASILKQYPNETGTKLAVQLFDTNNEARTVVLSMQAEAGQWRLKVPMEVVKKYSAALGGASVAQSVKK